MMRKKGAAARARAGRAARPRAVAPVSVATASIALATSALALLACATTTEASAPDDVAACPRARYIQPADAPPLLGGYPGPGPSTAGTATPEMLADACARARQMPEDSPMRKLVEPYCPPIAPSAASAPTPQPASSTAAPITASASPAPGASAPP